MELYTQLAFYYDELFNVSSQKLAWLIKKLNVSADDKVLDLGCGTGQYVVELAERGINAYGIDYDWGMVDKAIKKIQKKNLQRSHVAVGDILNPYPFDTSFDGMVCLGNTLPHLENHKQVLECLKVARDHLTNNGRLILQTVNFDLADITNLEFPELTARQGEVKFYRQYHPHVEDKNKLIFEVQLDLSNQDNLLTDKTDLLIINKDDMENLLHDAGFSEYRFYSGFSDVHWQQDGDATVVVAKK